VNEIRRYEVDICADCIALKGEMCDEPGCIFIRCTMAEVRDYLDMMLIVPVINGVRIEPLQDGAPLTIPQAPRSLAGGDVIDLGDRRVRVLGEGAHIPANHRGALAVRNCATGRLSYIPKWRLLKAKPATPTQEPPR
jgi:hypothetical protein